MRETKTMKKRDGMVSEDAGELALALRARARSPALAAPGAASGPEVRAVAKRRQFSATYKLAVLEEADRRAGRRRDRLSRSSFI
jgi:hypothetical protein